jgi:hypothetical protein
MTRSRLIASVVAAVAVLVLAGVAIAATPKSGTWTARAKKSGGYFAVKKSAVVPVGVSKIIAAPTDLECNTQTLIVKTTKIKISKGRFSYDGPAYVDKSRAKGKLGRLVWTGTFTSATKAKGTYRFMTEQTAKVQPGGAVTFLNQPCDTGTKPWTGAFVPPAKK